jgi:hypothetical protein
MDPIDSWEIKLPLVHPVLCCVGAVNSITWGHILVATAMVRVSQLVVHDGGG